MSTITAWQKLLDDPAVTDICVNGGHEIFSDRGHGLEPEELSLGDDELKTWVLDQLSLAGKSWDARHPFIDASLGSGHRLHVAFPPVARKGILVSLRRLPKSAQGSSAERIQVARQRWSSSGFFDKLTAIIQSGDSLIISGATGSGKTTLANDLLSFVPARERMIALEDTPELAPAHPHFLSLVSRPPNADGFGEVTLRSLLRQTLRMRPDRVILGECRGAEVLELLQALNTGHRGALATLHANSPRDALRRIELLCLMSAGSALSLSVIRELVALGVQWVTQVHRIGAERKITELWHIEGREGDTILMRPMIEVER